MYIYIMVIKIQKMYKGPIRSAQITNEVNKLIRIKFFLFLFLP